MWVLNGQRSVLGCPLTCLTSCSGPNVQMMNEFMSKTLNLQSIEAQDLQPSQLIELRGWLNGCILLTSDPSINQYPSPHSPTPSYQQGDQWRERLRIGARSFAFLRSGELTRSRPPITTPADERAVKERKEREKKKERKDTFQRVWTAAAVRSKLSFDRNFKDEVKSHIRKKAQFQLLSQRFLNFSVLEFRDFTSSILIFSSISM